MTVVCPSCGASNRLPDSPPAGKVYVCARCRTRLVLPSAAAAGADHTIGPAVAEPAPETPGGRTGTRAALRKTLIIHPVLIAIFPVLALYANNADEVKPSEVVLPLIVAALAALLLVLLFLVPTYLILRDRKTPESGHPYRLWDLRKAGIIASIFLGLFFSFGHVLIWAGWWDTLHRTMSPDSGWFLLSTMWSLLLVVAAYIIITRRGDLARVTALLNIVAATLVLVVTINVVIGEVRASDPGSGIVDSVEAWASSQVQPESPPDIYYIIFDRYGSSATLKDMYNFDNSEFLDFLASRGFYVASESVANYPFTTLSLTSSLNMDYLHEGAAADPIGGNLQDYRVWRYLKSLGYEFVHFGSWWEQTRENPYADRNINYYAMPEFSWFLFQTTWAYPLSVEMDIVDEWWEAQYKRVLYKFEELARIPQVDQPTFVFAHMFVPHPPFVFNSDGSFRTRGQQALLDKDAQYLGQLQATNDMLTKLIDQLLEDSETSPIIILQADEGPRREARGIMVPSSSIATAGDEELREKMRVLNAYRLPGVDQDALYRDISPVNSFRLVFNLYFGTDFEMLPDRSYVYDSSGAYIDVTDRVKYE